MGWNTLVPGNDIENLKEDRKASKGIEQYRVSAKAIYTKGEYLPMSAITDVRIQRSTYTPSCACGKGIPVFKIRVDYGADKPMVMMIEKEKNAERMISMISQACPDIRIDRTP